MDRRTVAEFAGIELPWRNDRRDVDLPVDGAMAEDSFADDFAALFSDEILKFQLAFRRSFDLAASSSCPNLSNFSASMILRTFGNIFFSSSSTA